MAGTRGKHLLAVYADIPVDIELLLSRNLNAA